MRLEKIKLSGFKSFVDPTTVQFPSNLVGVIGPNGCGKSNIIDAVRWVLGESSAKMLRGESMTDVIFNGSTGRKPVGVASVELIFDNSDATVGGEFANFSTISVRREVNRESQSHYFLNNTRCRRKDIFNAFYGTGLGARSYSVIEQGMISRFIEAKPEELRSYLEEVAGISKYKARRRETENRINHTRENLSRLTDIREELEKQLRVLDRQAKAAQRYKELKAEEKVLKAQLHALHWRENQNELSVFEKSLNEAINNQEAKKSQLSSIQTEIEKHKQQQIEATDQFNNAQQRYYEVKNEVARIEQAIKHQQEQQQKLLEDQQQLHNDLSNTQDHLAEDRDKADDIEREIAELAPQIEASKQAKQTAEEKCRAIEDDMQNWQLEWEAFNEQAAQIKQTFEVEKTKINALESKTQRLRERQLKAEGQQQHINLDDLTAQLQTVSADLEKAQKVYQQSQDEAAAMDETIQQLRTEQQQRQQQYDDMHQQQRELLAKQVTLQALQNSSLEQSSDSVKHWCESQGLDVDKRLLNQITVEKGWEKAVAIVLGEYLEAVCVEQFDPLFKSLQDLQHGNLLLVDVMQEANINIATDSLASKVTASGAMTAMLNDVIAVEGIEQAMSVRGRLQGQQSVVTKDGIWLGRHWLRVAKPKQAEMNPIERKHELEHIESQLHSLNQQMLDDKQALEQLQASLQQSQQQKESAHQQLLQSKIHVSDCASQQQSLQNRLQQDQHKLQELNQEMSELSTELDRTESELSEARSVFESSVRSMEAGDGDRRSLSEQRESLRLALQQQKERLDEASVTAHEVEVRYETNRSTLQSLQSNIERFEQRLSFLHERKQQLSLALQSQGDPEQALQSQLKEKLDLHVSGEKQLAEKRQLLESVQSQLESLQLSHTQLDNELSTIRDTIEKIRIESQALRVKSDNLVEQVKSLDAVMSEVVTELTDDANSAAWQEKLSQVENRIIRLGAINLAADEEYEGLQERKIYLDSQNNDLVEALTLLEDAISKIDRETKARFKETFDTVNNTFQQLFPKVFGGGSACLELAQDDLLSSGVTVMAQPPGKKNSTIHLLSGGEKALTAVSLVFAIFQLNPAPFCMLDEVDAPLDDMNLLRYCSLVKEMSEKVQFIFVTHNKIAMEMAQQLMGVTMHEPGVSRLVTVDVEQAVEMIEA